MSNSELSALEDYLGHVMDFICDRWKEGFDSHGLNYMSGIHHGVRGDFEASQDAYLLFNVYYDRLYDE